MAVGKYVWTLMWRPRHFTCCQCQPSSLHALIAEHPTTLYMERHVEAALFWCHSSITCLVSCWLQIERPAISPGERKRKELVAYLTALLVIVLSVSQQMLFLVAAQLALLIGRVTNPPHLSASFEVGHLSIHPGQATDILSGRFFLSPTHPSFAKLS